MIPDWLLKLLPMFDYICPKCKAEVPRKSRECPHCHEHYGMPLKVPPVVLKGSKKLEDYVHKHVFPKISADYREYLTRYFTVLFTDGFESGVLPGNWTSTSGTITKAVANNRTHHGKYSFEVQGIATAWTYGAVGKTLPSTYSKLYLRCYVLYNNLPLSNTQELLGPCCIDTAEAQTTLWSILKKDAGGYKWGIRTEDSTPVYTNTYEANYSTVYSKRWYCVELFGDLDNSIERLWIDGKLHLDLNVSLAAVLQDFNSISLIEFAFADEAPAFTVVHDCAVVADNYIGPELGMLGDGLTCVICP